MLRCVIGVLLVLVAPDFSACAQDVRLKDLGRFLGWRDNQLVGYGIVTGLAGSGDSPRNPATRQALANALSQLGMTIPVEQVQSRNVAIVLVNAVLPPAGNVGDKIDVTVNSIGDARSLAGGSLLLTPLNGPDHKTYALAQGAVVVGGYKFETELNAQQKNYPTVGVLPGGGTVEVAVEANLLQNGYLIYTLRDGDMTTASRVADAINRRIPGRVAVVRDASAVRINVEGGQPAVNGLVAQLENLTVIPDTSSRVVINERTGTVVAGGGVQISTVVISQGDIKVSIKTENYGSQPAFVAGNLPEVRSLFISNTKLDVAENEKSSSAHFPNTTIGDLVKGLTQLRVGTRDIISILSAIKAAGALRADLIVQ